MKSALALFALLSLAVFVQGTEYPEEDNVVVLGDDNFDSFINSHDYVLAEFYAPWCGHCKSLAPEYAKAAKILKGLDPAVPLIKVDATQNSKVTERFEVRGYPTLKFFSKGQASEYNGGRTEKDIVNWIKKKLLPPSSEVKSVEEAEKLINDHEVAVIFFGDAGSAAHEAYVSAARALEDIAFGHTADSSIASNYQIEDLSSPKIVLFKKFDEGRSDFSGKLETEDIKNFIEGQSLPLVAPFTQKLAQKIFGDGKPALFLFHEGGDAAEKAVKALKEAASALKNKIIVSISGVRDGLPKKLAEFVGVAEKDIPNLRIVDTSSEDMHKYVLNGDITADAIIQFYEDFVAKRLKPIFKSEDIPENNNEPVKVVVGKSFESIVLDPTKDVLVEFYAPWCGHCKSLAPIYDKLAKNLAHIKDLVIAKVDSTANEIPGVRISGFPTIKFFPANNKTPIDFSGERNEEGFLKFLKEHVTVGTLDIPDSGASKEDL